MNLFGRREIYADFDEINSGNVLKVLTSAKTDILANQVESEYLYKYYKGDQPILYRTKEIRPEICNRIVENRANEIVAFKVGYLCGEPIQYIARSSNETVARDIGNLNDLMLAESKATKDKKLFEWACITGVGYRLVEIGDEEQPFNLHTLDSRYAYVIKSHKIGNKVLAGGCYYYKNNGAWFSTPAVGDQVFFNVSGGINHTGIVVGVTGGVVTCVEGNSSDAVRKNNYNLGTSYIAGFGRPNWSIFEEGGASEPEPNPAPEPEPPKQDTCEVTVKLPVIKYGDASMWVKVMQTLLIGRGFNCGWYENNNCCSFTFINIIGI